MSVARGCSSGADRRVSDTEKGYSFRLLHAHLGDEHQWVEYLPEDLTRQFLGGAALGARILYPLLRRDLSALDPESPLLFMTGPLTGTVGPAVGRFVLCARSPATGLWGESNVGGFWGPALRTAGYDGLMVHGRARSPIYLVLRGGEVEFRPADHLWGRTDTYETQRVVQQELGNSEVRVGSIGLAGEKRLPQAAVLFDHGRMAGRTGMGAIMGSKNLKAVAVVRGDSPLPLADALRFSALRKAENRRLRNDLVSEGLRDFGTASGSEIFDYFGMMPKLYFSRGELQGAEAIAGTKMAETILSGVSACHGCVIACGRRVRLPGESIERKGPEYESMIGFGPNLGITDLSAVTRLSERCDELGLDTISVSNTIGLAFLLYERGLITQENTEGLELGWGDIGVVEQLLERIGEDEGFGHLLAQGAHALAEEFGAPELAAQVNGLEIAYHDPRGASGMALVYATSPRGGCHNQGPFYLVEMGQSREDVGVEFYPRQAGVEKVPAVVNHQNWNAVLNALVGCIFANTAAEDWLGLTNAATGFDYSLGDLIEVGRRSWDLRRAINRRLGLRKEGERLPAHLMQPLGEGGAAGYVPPLDDMLDAYYRAREWDPKIGGPSVGRLKSIGLEEPSDYGVPWE